MHEMHDAVMGAAKAELVQHMVGIADKVTIGEKQQFDDVPARRWDIPSRFLPGRPVNRS